MINNRSSLNKSLEQRVARLESLLNCNGHLAKNEVRSRTIWDDMAAVNFNKSYYQSMIEEFVNKFSKFNAEVTKLKTDSLTVMTDNLRIDIDYDDEDEIFTVYPYDHKGYYYGDYYEKSVRTFESALKFASKVINEVESQLH